jgi:hypothetical protein
MKIYLIGECPLGHWQCSPGQACQEMEEPCNGTCPDDKWKLICQKKCVLIEKPDYFECEGNCHSILQPCNGSCYLESWKVNCNGECEKNLTYYNCNGSCTPIDIPCEGDCKSKWKTFLQVIHY